MSVGLAAETAVDTTLARVRALAPIIAARADEIEQRRGLPADVVESLRGAGCLRMLAPVASGGDELPLPHVVEVIETLARADGAAGWAVSQIALSQLILAYFPRAAVQRVYAGGPDVYVAGAVAPKGRATREPGGWRVAGQWPFVTGCEHAAWFYVQCVLRADHQIQAMPDGIPMMRLALVPRADVEIVDTWRALGLRGTGSHDVRVMRASCPEERTGALIGGRPSLRGVPYAIPLFDQAGLFIAAVALGIAQGALDAIVALAATGKRSAFSRIRLAESRTFQHRLGEAAMTVRAARALLHDSATAAWEAAAAEGAADRIEAAALRATALQVTAMSSAVVNNAYGLGGGSAVYDGSPLQRRLRDIHTASQHAWNGRGHTGSLGALLVGEEVEAGLF